MLLHSRRTRPVAIAGDSPVIWAKPFVAVPWREHDGLPRGGGLRAFVDREDVVDYWDRERPPEV